MPPTPLVGTATLEVSVVPLAQQIETFARRVMAQGVRQVVIIPLFLLAGVHVKEDLPREIAAAAAQLPARMRLICTPFLGSDATFKRFVANRLSTSRADRCLLVAHGSRRPAGNRSVKQLAAILDAEVAFWSVPPDWEAQVLELMQQGHQHIAIAPYFLFPGSITDAITRRTEELAERLPKLWLRLLAPLGTSAELGQVVAEMALSLPHECPPGEWETEPLAMTGNGITA
jgi:sirohydrochlorin ferrochelatase